MFESNDLIRSNWSIRDDGNGEFTVVYPDTEENSSSNGAAVEPADED